MKRLSAVLGIFIFLTALAVPALAADRVNETDLSRLFDASAYSGLAGSLQTVLAVLGIAVGAAAVVIVVILLVLRKKRSGNSGDEDK